MTVSALDLTTPAAAAKPTGERPEMISLNNVSRRFGKKQDLLGKIAMKIGAAKAPPTVHAVDGVSLSIRKGEVVGLVGESGCGKSTLGRIVAGILPQSSGNVMVSGKSHSAMSNAERARAKLLIQMIFQNPFASLNPRMTVSDIILEAPSIHGLIKGNKRNYLAEQMRRVGLDPAYQDRLPHQFSGGQRQRIGIARALAVQPEFLVCDESVAALDVSIQAQVLNLFMDLREQLDLTYLFISHDLGVVEHISDRVAIMYLGRIIEEAPTAEIFSRANHPYTQALLEEVPRIETVKRHFKTIKGELPSPLAPPPGCHFHPRCPHAMPRCKIERPALKQLTSNHSSACHLND